MTATISAAAGTAAGNSTVTIKGSGGGLTRTAQIAVTVVVPNFALTPSVSSATVAVGGSKAIAVSTKALSGFRSAILLSVSGLPKGVSATFAPTSIPSPGNGSSTLTLTAISGTVAGVYTLTLKGVGQGITKTQTLRVTVVVPIFTLTLSGTKVILARGGTMPVTVTTGAINGFRAGIALSVSGLPRGVTAGLAPVSIASPGSGRSILTLRAARTAAVGSFGLTVKAAGKGVTKTQTIGLTVR